MRTKYFWLATIDGKPCGSFETRELAIKWLKPLLKQNLKDFDKQDKPCEFTYPVEMRKIEIKRYEQRKTFLGF